MRLNKILYKTLAVLLACLFLTGTAADCFSKPVDTYRSSSVLADGRWARVRVSQDGMQLLTNEQLKDLGFSDPSKVRVYGYGGRELPLSLDSTTPDDLPMQLVVRTARGILFYGTGTVDWQLKGSKLVHRQNPYGTVSYYFLSDRDAEDLVREALDEPYGSDDEVVTAVTHTLLHEQEMAAAGHTGGDLFGEDFRATSTRTFSFDMPGAVDDVVRYKVFFGAKASGTSKVYLLQDDDEIGSVAISGVSDSDIHLSLKSVSGEGRIKDGKGELGIKFDGTGVVTTARLDFIEAAYLRELRLTDNQLLFMHNVRRGTHEVFAIEGCEAFTVIWDVSDPVSPRPVKYHLEGSRAMFAPTGTGLKKYVVFNPDNAGLIPSSTGNVASQDIHAMPVPDMVIVTPQEYKAQAERVADMHRGKDGMIVHVLTPETIYNEFSSGTPDVTAIRRMLKMWYDRGSISADGHKLQHCLLFGRATYDQRMITDQVRNAGYPRVLTWQSTLDNTLTSTSLNETSSYLTDNYIAMLEDCSLVDMNNVKMSIGVGRMPVKNLSEARAAVDKLLKYAENPGEGAWRNNVMIIADDGDRAAHLDQSEQTYKQLISSGNGSSFLYERLYLDAFPLGTNSTTKSFPLLRERMSRLLDEGVSYWQYIGHANPTSWTAENILTYSDITSMDNKHLPVLYTASCEFIRFDSDAVSGAEVMWLHPSSGIIAAVAANRKVYISRNEYVSVAFGREYFRRDKDGLPMRLGDVYKNTINAVSDDNRHRYALMGDPALRVLSPSYSVRVDELAGVDVENIPDAADYPVIPARSRVVVKGTVLSPDGLPATDFNGYVVPTLYDAEIVVTTFGRRCSATVDDGKVSTYNDRKNRLYSGNFKVENGCWEATLLLPEEIENNFSPARLTLYAYSDDGRDANGATDNFYIYGWDDTVIDDTTDPEIKYMYLNSAAFHSGATVCPDPVFMAKVRDESGINISSSGVGRQMTIVVDGRRVFDNVADYFTTDPEDPCAGNVAYKLGNLEVGRHSLEFLVWDNAGNSSRGSFDFSIADVSDMPELDIYTNANPAVSSVTFYVNSPDAGTGYVDVFDLSGRKVWSSSATMDAGVMAATWDLLDAGGTRVPRGIYLYRATVTGRDGKEKRATKKLAVGEGR